MKRHILFTLSIIHSFSLGAQEPVPARSLNSFRLDLGVNRLKEENLHPKVHTGMVYALVYENTRQRNHISGFGFGMRYSRLKTSLEALSASANLQLSGNYHFLLEGGKSEHLTNFIGPELNLHYNLSYYPNWDESHLYWGNYLSLGIRNNLSYSINERQSLQLDIGLSIFSLFSRPELNRQYKIDDLSPGGILANMHSNMETGTINKSLTAFFRAEYQFHTSGKITQALCFSHHYGRLKSRGGRPVQNSISGIGLKIYFR